MITEANSVYSFPGFIDGEPLFKQMKEYTYNSKSPLLQANSSFSMGINRYPPPWVKPQSVKLVTEQFKSGHQLDVMA